MALRPSAPASGASRLLDVLPPGLLRRLGLARDAAPTPEDPAEDRALIARALSMLFLSGATLSLVWLLLPHARASHDGGVIAMTLGAYATGLVLFVGFDRLPMVVLKLAVTAATVVITGAMFANHENGSTYVLYYFWATVYAFSFFSARQAALQTSLVGVAFALVLYVQQDIWQEEVARWLLTMSTTLAAGLLVRYLAGALRYRSLHDPLTCQPNRRFYLARLDDELERCAQDPRARPVAVVFLDLDGFKYVNDSLGHHVGDGLLMAVAERLGEAVRPGDLTARFGGDEFAVLCPDIESRGHAVAIGERVIKALEAPLIVGGHELRISASVGVAISEPGADNGETLLRDADSAMYAAKHRGRACCELFGDALRGRISERLGIEKDLRSALERDELEVYYQPIVALAAEHVVGVEALLRWRHPQRGLVQPGDFIAIAEETGLIVGFGAFVLDEAVRQLAEWDAGGGALAGIGMSVNLSARQMVHADLLALVDRVVGRHRIAASRLTLELTESMLMDEGMGPALTMGALRARGVRIALDDFGTGYSSLSYLQRFPLTELKLDRAFVRGLGTGGREDAITGAVLGMARALQITVVAEGIENHAQLDVLRGLGCEQGQGFLFARPALPGDVLAELESRGSRLRLAS